MNYIAKTWTVVLSRPLMTENPNDYQFEDKGQLAFAVWQGGDRNVGGTETMVEITEWFIRFG